MGCEVLVGTRANHRRCELPGRERWDGHDVCSYHRLQVRELPFEWRQLLSFTEIQRRGDAMTTGPRDASDPTDEGPVT